MKYPFKFLDAYTRDDRDIFFGREQEIEDLYRMLFQTNLCLLYGESGTGKTSLIRCGLANRFKDSQWLDLYIRRGTDINASLLEVVQKNIPEFAGEEQPSELDWFENLVEEAASRDSPEHAEIASGHPVAKALHELYLATFTPIYLIFDQFEELYTLGNAGEQRQLNETITELVRLPLPVKILIVMREEYLAKLYELEMAVPQLRNKKLRIEPMDLPRVEQVILQATLRNPSSNVRLSKGREQEIARVIIENIREGDVNVKLPYLQVFMDRLYELASGQALGREKEVTISLDLIREAGNIGDVLADFIERQNQRIFKKLDQNYRGLPSDLIWQLLSPFATIDGTKIPIKQAELMNLRKALAAPFVEDPGSFIKDAVAELENSRILRFRKEDQTYELAHDTLAKQISEKRSEEEKAYLKAKRIVSEGLATFADTRTLLSKEQLAYIQPYAQRMRSDLTDAQVAFIRDSRRKRQRQLVLLRLGVITAFVIAVLVILIVLHEQRNTRQALDDMIAAQEAREKTELRILLQDAAQIAKGNNCPPNEMRRTIDSLYRKYKGETELNKLYTETTGKLGHCER